MILVFQAACQRVAAGAREPKRQAPGGLFHLMERGGGGGGGEGGGGGGKGGGVGFRVVPLYCRGIISLWLTHPVNLEEQISRWVSLGFRVLSCFHYSYSS